MFDVLCVGNVIIDAFLHIHDANEHCRINKETNELCFPVGEKVPVESAVFHVGGNACNVSVGLSRLGLRASLIAEIGKEAFSSKVLTTLREEHVDTSHLLVSDTLTSFAMGISFKGDRNLFVHHVKREHNFSYDGLQPIWIYLSSIGDSWKHVYRGVHAFVEREGVKLAFNPGTRQIDDSDAEAVHACLQVSEIVFLNKEEAIKITNNKKQITNNTERENREYVSDLLEELQKLGAKNAVITDGKRGAFVIDTNGKIYHQSVLDAPIVERTGAGDSFASGFLAATIYGHDISTALEWGSQNASAVIGKVGAQAGLLTKEQMEKRV